MAGPCLLALLGAFVAAPPASALDLRAGDILVDDAGNQSFRGGRIFRVDPVSGAQTGITGSGREVSRSGAAVERDGHILYSVGFRMAPQNRFLARLDPATGTETVVARGIGFRDIVVAPNRDILLITGVRVVRVDPATGAQTTVSSGGLFVSPAAIALEANGNIVVADTGQLGGAVIRVDAETGAQTTLASGGAFVDPTGIAVEPSGTIVVADPDALDGSGAVIRLDPTTGTQTIVSSGGSFSDPRGVAVEADGRIVVADASAFRPVGGTPSDSTGGLIRVDPVTGAQRTVSSGGLFTSPRDVAVVPALNEPPDCTTVAPNPANLRRAPHNQFETITLSGATDPDGDTLSYRIDTVQQDEPVTGTPGKQSIPDAQLIGVTGDTNQVWVRAESSPPGNGRVYRIAYTVSDGTAGCSGIAKVSVTRNKHRAAVDDGDTTRWDSFTGDTVLP